MLKRVALFLLVMALGLSVSAMAGQGTGRISGIARDAQDKVLSNAKVQLRNVDSGLVVARTRAAATGAFEFAGLNPGNYVVEIADESDRIIGVSASMALAAGGIVSGLMIAASAAGALAGAAAAGGLGAFFASTGGILLLAGIGSGVTAGVVAAARAASPSR